MTERVATGGSASARRLGVFGAIGVLFGIVLSGPPAVAVVGAMHPQPPWQGPEMFARSYHPAQLLPYLGGIPLVAGLVLLIAAIHSVAREDQKPGARAALVFVAIFATLIFSNYIVQITLVPALAREPLDANGPILSVLSMANPRSLAWALEMWGWGFLGVATWLVAPVFQGGRIERAASWMCVSNGLVSIAGVVWTVLQPGWVFTSGGMVAYGSWNVLLGAVAVLALIVFRRRSRRALP